MIHVIKELPKAHKTSGPTVESISTAYLSSFMNTVAFLGMKLDDFVLFCADNTHLGLEIDEMTDFGMLSDKSVNAYDEDAKM